MIIIAGIKSCDTCRKALAWLKQNEIAHEFHDLRADGLDKKRLDAWIKACGWENLLNRRSTTWRGLSDSEKANIDAKSALTLMLKHPTLIKRPVFEAGQDVHVGFTESVRAVLA